MDVIKGALFATGGLLKVRALLAYFWSGLTAYLFIDTGSAPPEVMTVTSAVVGYYFATRGSEGD